MAEKEQEYAFSCGAACLLCAAQELGVREIPENRSYSLWKKQCSLILNENCERRLYQVTSGNLGGSPSTWGISMPSDMVKCAKLLNLKVRVVAERTWTVRGLKIFYGTELTKLRSQGVLKEMGGHFLLKNHSVYRPSIKERELRLLVNRSSGELHYVMIRPDGTVMDPDAPKRAIYLPAVKASHGMHSTGLSIFLQGV